MKKRILVVDDSATARWALTRAIAQHPELEVVQEATNAAAALRAVRSQSPDLVTMDVCLGDEDGVEVAKEIMHEMACPIAIVTALDTSNADLVFRALRAGALEVLAKPRQPDLPGAKEEIHRFGRTLRALANVPVVTRHRGGKTLVAEHVPITSSPILAKPSSPTRLIAIGASTGGPPLIRDILEKLEAPAPVPIAIVQHITRGFVEGLAHWLSSSTHHRVTVCRHAHQPEPGNVYLAPDDAHLALNSQGYLVPRPGEPRGFQMPSVDEFFESIPSSWAPEVTAVLLTGMGSDGAEGLTKLRREGATTIAQDPETCVVGGMPGAAIRLGGAARVLSPTGIVQALTERMRPGLACPPARSADRGVAS